MIPLVTICTALVCYPVSFTTTPEPSYAQCEALIPATIEFAMAQFPGRDVFVMKLECIPELVVLAAKRESDS